MTTETTNTMEQARELAVERLARLLERQTPINARGFTVNVAHSGEELHQLARLRVARSRYSLKSVGDLERVGKGAWLRRRYC